MTPPSSPITRHPTSTSVWPFVLAAGLTLALFGLVVWTLAFSAVGIGVLVAGVVGWVRELVAGEHEEHVDERA